MENLMKSFSKEDSYLEYLDFSQIHSSMETIRGSFSPENLSVFLNASADDFDEHLLTVFHERFHNWQFLFTPYGHLKWGAYRSVSADIVNIWLDATETKPSERHIPACHLLEENGDDVVTIKKVLEIFAQEQALSVLEFMERDSIYGAEYELLSLDKEKLIPKIKLGEKEFVLNGIDIIESFAKYQEAILGELVLGKNFEDTMNPHLLRKEYYIAFLYFIEQVGIKRFMEFPIVCEIALLTDKLCKTEDIEQWKNNHPAWRFIKVVEYLKDNPDMMNISFENLKENFSSYMKLIIERCNFECIDSIWTESLKYLESCPELEMGKEMLKAIKFKEEHKWILSYPLFEENSLKELYQFQPLMYHFTDISFYPHDNEKLNREILFENEFQSFAHQIRGNMSKCCLFKDELQCGFSYLGIKGGCDYLVKEKCTGSISHSSEIYKPEFDSDGNLISGCSFEAFLNVLDTSIKDIRMGTIGQKLTFKLFEDVAKKFGRVK